MKTLTAPISVPAVLRWAVVGVEDHPDDDVPSIYVQVRLQGLGTNVYASPKLRIYDNLPSDCLSVNPSPQGYGDRILNAAKVVSGAYTTVAAANLSNSNRAVAQQAVEVALLASGIVDSVSLAST